jgi:tetratricopeptide (TPR) repeat protein
MVRQYAAESLRASCETEAIKVRHRDWFLALAEEAEPGLREAEQADWLRRLEAEHDNLRAALAFTEADEQGAEAGLRLAGALNLFWIKRGEFHEGRFYLKRALEREGAQSATAAKAIQAAGVLAHRQGDYASARMLHEASLTISSALANKGGMACSITGLGEVAYLQGDYDTARTLLEEGLAIRRELGDRFGIAESLQSLGSVAFAEGDRNTARSLYEQSLAIRRELGDQFGIADSLQCLGSVAYSQGDYHAAQRLYGQGMTIRRELGDQWGIAFTFFSLGGIAHTRGDFEAARTLLEEALTIQRGLGCKKDIAHTLYSLGAVTCAQHDLETAQALLEEALTIQRELGCKKDIAHTVCTLGAVAYAQNDLETAQTLLEEGLANRHELGNSHVVHLLGSLGHLERAAGDYARATNFYHESLLLRQDMGDLLPIIYSLEDFAGLATEQGQYERAVRLLGAEETWAATIGRTPPVAYAAEYERTVTAARTVLNEEEFAAAWNEGRAMTLEQAIDYALDTGDAVVRGASP